MKRPHITSIQEAENYINNIPKFTKKHSSEETKRFLEKLGNPDQNLQMIHVAGTNGKGSVCNYLQNILTEAGYTVGVFSSPHLVNIRERFVVNSEMISEDEFMRCFQIILDTIVWDVEEEEFYHPTYFEFLFFLCMLSFQKTKPDYCILETGLGGRLDATNSVSDKLLSIITRISLDHTEYLGDTLSSIAYEKAGIMKKNGRSLCFVSDAEVEAEFVKVANEKNVHLSLLKPETILVNDFHDKSIDFCISDGYYYHSPFSVSTVAYYQAENAALAVKAVEILFEENPIHEEIVRAGLWKAHWAGRMEEVLPNVYVDGAHNEDGIRAFLDSVRPCVGSTKILFGVVTDKDYHSMAHKIVESKLFDEIYAVTLDTYRSVDGNNLQEIFAKEQVRVPVFDTVENALKCLLPKMERSDVLYIAGSLYLVGEVKELISKGGSLK